MKRSLPLYLIDLLLNKRVLAGSYPSIGLNRLS